MASEYGPLIYFLVSLHLHPLAFLTHSSDRIGPQAQQCIGRQRQHVLHIPKDKTIAREGKNGHSWSTALTGTNHQGWHGQFIRGRDRGHRSSQGGVSGEIGQVSPFLLVTGVKLQQAKKYSDQKYTLI